MASVLSAAEPHAYSIDHVGIGAADLDHGIAWLSDKTGVKAVKGGVHPGRGTQNALMSLGGGTYLEIIAPAPGGKLEGEETELVKLKDPKPVFYAVHTPDIAATSRLLKENGFGVSAIDEGSRKRPDGAILKWKTIGLSGAGLDAAPFFIEWDSGSPHPSTTSPGGCTLTGLEVYDREASALTKLFSILSLDVAARVGSRPAIRVTLACPKGAVILGP